MTPPLLLSNIYITMNNLPTGYIEDDPQHYTECEDQPVGFPCICEHLAQERFDKEADDAYDNWRDNQLTEENEN